MFLRCGGDKLCDGKEGLLRVFFSLDFFFLMYDRCFVFYFIINLDIFVFYF